MKRFIFFFSLIFGTIVIQAQVPDSLSMIEKTTDVQDVSIVEKAPILQDSTKKKARKDRFLYRVFNKDYPNPKTAMLLSFALPGTGQIYNKRWWKVPLVYGGMGWSIFSIVRNTNQFFRFRDIYIQALAGEPHEFSGTRLDNVSGLERIRDGFDRNRQLSFVAAILVYGIQGAEAFVDAHLKTFDVSDDLSLRVKLKPSMETDYINGTVTGIGLSFRLEQKKQTPTFFITP